MRFHTRKWVKPEDLNPNNTLFGGRLLQWIDEEAALYAMIQLDNRKIVTKYISEIDFISAPKQELHRNAGGREPAQPAFLEGEVG